MASLSDLKDSSGSGVNGNEVLRRREGEIFFGNDGDSLGYEVGEYGEEGIRAESFSEVVEGCARGSIAEGEAGEESQSCVVSEFKGEVSFGFGESEVNKEDGFKEGGGVISVGAFRFVMVFDNIKEEVAVDRFEEYFEGVIIRYEVFDGEIKEGELVVFSHCCPPFCAYSKDRESWGYVQGGGYEDNELFQWI